MSRTNTYLRELPPGLTHIDVYWVLRLFNVTDPCAQHAVKKLLADGSGDKGRAENMREAWETLDRWREMEGESAPKELRGHHPDGLTRWIEESRRQYEAMDPWLKPDRQEQVRERHDIVPDERWTLESAITAAIDGDADARGWLAERGLHWDAGHANYPWYVSADSEVDEAGPLTMQADGTYEQPDQRPPDRPLASHCPDGGACRHKCGLEPCKEASE